MVPHERPRLRKENAMRMIDVNSDRALTQIELQKIQEIFQESKCPNESLINSIDGCKGVDGEQVLVGAGGKFAAHIEV